MRHKPAVSSFNEKCEQAVIFARVSSERQEKGASIDAQLETVYNYCEKKGFTIIKEFTITESSSRGDRKQYKEMLAFIQKNKHKVAIVVNCVDRLQRSYKDTPALDEMRRNGKIEVHFLKENLILHKDSNGSDILFWNLHVLMANSYILQLSDNVKRSQRYNRSIGKWQCKAPIGYLNTRDENGRATLIVDEERAPIIRKIFEWYATGRESLESIVLKARKLGLKTTLHSKTNSITKTTVRSILCNPFYYGMMDYPDPNDPTKYIEVQHIYPPLISKSLFDRVQEQLGEKGRIRCHPARNGLIPFTFRGLIRCGDCGCAITNERHTKKSGRKYIILRCSHKNIECNQPLVNEEVLLQQLKEEVFDKLKIDSKLIPALKQEARQLLDEETTLKLRIQKNSQARLKDLVEKEKKLLDLYIEGKLNDAIYQTKQLEISKEKEELKNQADEYVILDNQMKEAFERVIEIAGNFAVIMENASPLQKNELLHLLLEDCVLENQVLKYKIRKPFDILVSNPKDNSWLNIQPNDLPKYQDLAKEINALAL